MRFFLIGFMGSGKSFWARKLSEKYNMPCIDLDKEIEKEMNTSISDYIKRYGEEKFRQIETEVLTDTINRGQHFIMATGGGTPCFHENLHNMNETGITIYLNTSSHVLYARLIQERKDRPLLSHVNDTELESTIDSILTTRVKYYERCKYFIDMDHDPESTFAEIFKPYV